MHLYERHRLMVGGVPRWQGISSLPHSFVFDFFFIEFHEKL